MFSQKMPQAKRNKRIKNSHNHEILKLLRNNKRLNQKLKDLQSILELNEQSDDVKQFIQLREQYKKLINQYGLDLSPNDYIIEQIKRFRSKKEDLKKKYETLRDEYDSLIMIEQHSLLKTENEELTTRYKDLQFYFNRKVVRSIIIFNQINDIYDIQLMTSLRHIFNYKYMLRSSSLFSFKLCPIG